MWIMEHIWREPKSNAELKEQQNKPLGAEYLRAQDWRGQTSQPFSQTPRKWSSGLTDQAVPLAISRPLVSALRPRCARRQPPGQVAVCPGHPQVPRRVRELRTGREGPDLEPKRATQAGGVFGDQLLAGVQKATYPVSIRRLQSTQWLPDRLLQIFSNWSNRGLEDGILFYFFSVNFFKSFMYLRRLHCPTVLLFVT